MADEEELAAIRLAFTDNNTYRLRQIAERKKLQDRLTPTTFYLGQSDDGRALVKTVGGSITPLKTIGNVQPSMGAVGRAAGGGFDPGSTVSPVVSKKRTAKGEVAVLVRQVEGDRQRFWIGGDRSTPTQVVDLPVSAGSVSATLELTGAGKADWIVSLKYGTTAQVIYGSGEGSWTVTDPRVPLMNYRGDGFWNSGAILTALLGSFTTTEDAPFATMDGLQEQLGAVGGSTCYSGVEGLSTVAVAYCENYFISEPTSLSRTGYDRRSGIVNPNPALPFSGTNTYDYTQNTNAFYEGTASGPGYLGPGGSICSLGDPGTSGTAMFPRRRANQTFSLNRSFSSQTYSLSLTGGSIALSTGSETLSYSGSGSADIGAFASVKQQNLSGFCSPFEFNNLWKIGVDSFETWPEIAPSMGGSESSVIYNQTNNFTIAPGLTKTVFFDAVAPPGNAAPTGTQEGYTTTFLFDGGVFYSELLAEGQIDMTVIDGPRSSPPATTFQTKLLFGGGEYIATGSFSLYYTWQSDPENSLPMAHSVSVDDSVFDQKQIAEVTKIKAVPSGATINFEGEEETIPAKVLKINLSGTKTILDSRYWAKS
jgi:hypothetical protein